MMGSFFLVGFFQSLFLSLLIFSKKGKKAYDYILVVFILLLGSWMVFLHYHDTEFYALNPWLVVIDFFFWPLFGPMLFLYIDVITSKTQKFEKKHAFHFLPLVIVLIGFYDYIKISGTTAYFDYSNNTLFYKISSYVWHLITHVYFVACIIKLHLFRRSVKNYFSYTENVDLKWLMVLTYGYGAFILASVVMALTNVFGVVMSQPFMTELFCLIIVLYLFGIGYYGFKQRGIFDAKEVSSIRSESKSVLKPKKLYAKSRLADDEMNELAEALIKEMEVNEAYLDYSLDIRMLAEKLDTTTYKISQTLNILLKKNFFDFVNEYRVEFAKKCLSSPEYDHEKIMSIAYDSGFKSKTSFYSVFKKYTDLTPVAYREKYREII